MYDAIWHLSLIFPFFFLCLPLDTLVGAFLFKKVVFLDFEPVLVKQVLLLRQPLLLNMPHLLRMPYLVRHPYPYLIKHSYLMR